MSPNLLLDGIMILSICRKLRFVMLIPCSSVFCSLVSLLWVLWLFLMFYLHTGAQTEVSNNVSQHVLGNTITNGTKNIKEKKLLYIPNQIQNNDVLPHHFFGIKSHAEKVNSSPIFGYLIIFLNTMYIIWGIGASNRLWGKFLLAALCAPNWTQ